MLARAEFTVRPHHLMACSSSSQMRGSMGFTFRYIDTGYPAFGVDSWWNRFGSHKYVGEITEYWSASPYAGNASNAWNVNFNNGNDNANNKSNNNYVRLVRGGEWRT